MTLSPGTRFGPYEIADEIGAGGMGVVYRATDTNLKRDVAIKVLPESLATDKERLARFQREAELLASLNHPNIAQIYGLEKADGTGSVERLAESPGQIFPTSFLPDATGLLVYGTVSADKGDDIAIVRLEEEDRATPLLETTFEESYPQVSPDGRWLAYVSNESGSEEIYVRPFPDVDAGGRWQVSTGGGTQPLWARSGRELFYRTVEAVIAVPIETDPNFRQGNPEVMFEGNYLLAPGGPNYDVSPDGEQFLMIKRVEDESTTPRIIIVENWFEEVRRLAPAAE